MVVGSLTKKANSSQGHHWRPRVPLRCRNARWASPTNDIRVLVREIQPRAQRKTACIRDRVSLRLTLSNCYGNIIYQKTFSQCNNDIYIDRYIYLKLRSFGSSECKAMMCSERIPSNSSSGLSSKINTKSNRDSKAGFIFRFSDTVLALL